MAPRLAIVFCVHHKPWLMMGSLLTLAGQERVPADLFFLYNVGHGDPGGPSYDTYRAIAAASGGNTQLSPFDPRVRDVCQVSGWPSHEVDYTNDHALDSGAWYKFIRDGRWREYDYVLFAGEGLLFAHPRVLQACLAFAQRRGAAFIASGHEKRRVPRRAFVGGHKRGLPRTAMDQFHEEMSTAAFDVFRRDPEFRSIIDAWSADFPVETEHHVPGVWPGGRWWRQVRGRAERRWGPGVLPPVDRWRSRLAIRWADAPEVPSSPWFHEAGGYGVAPVTSARGLVQMDEAQGVTFHQVSAPEWFGCTVIHQLSRSFLERLDERLRQFGMYDVLDLPFSGSALEVVWGFLPAWLGVDKWFTNGFHRVRKHFATYRREDYPREMAGYINRYHRGRLAVSARGDFLRLEAWRPGLGDLRARLPAIYFGD